MIWHRPKIAGSTEIGGSLKYLNLQIDRKSGRMVALPTKGDDGEMVEPEAPEFLRAVDLEEKFMERRLPVEPAAPQDEIAAMAAMMGAKESALLVLRSKDWYANPPIAALSAHRCEREREEHIEEHVASRAFLFDWRSLD